MNDAVSNAKRVLIIGIEPHLVDYSHFPGMSAEKVSAGLAAEADKLKALGYETTFCLTDLGETARDAVTAALTQRAFDCVLIGAGVRIAPPLFLLFEQLINIIHQHAPQAKIAFNTSPADTAASIQRWV